MGAANDDLHMVKEQAIRARIKDAMRKWREAGHYTQKEMAEILGIPHKRYAKYEGENRGVPASVIAQFCLIADIDPAYILLGNRAKRAPRPARTLLKQNDNT
jgi:transcriptional regulator with XRE-family HTH domain